MHHHQPQEMERRRKLPAAAIAALGLACARGPSSQRAVELPPAPGAPEISLSEIKRGEWRLELRTPRATAGLRFARNLGESRAGRWQVESGFELVHEDEADFLRRKDGAVFQNTSLTVPARYVAQPKEYAPFSPYSDGGTLIYSGQFQVCAGKSQCPSDYRWQVKVTPPAGTHLVVAGAVHDSAFTFSDAGEGTNIYVGKTTPLESSHFVALIDPGLPAPVKGALYRLLPPMMDFFTARLGPLPFKPMLFASLDPNAPKGSGFSSQGSALPGQIFVHLYGEQWARNAADQRDEFLPWFFAHEAGHLFQSLGPSGDTYPMDQSWIHEGGADAFAALTIVELGGASLDYVKQRIESAVSECAVGLQALAGKPLDASAQAGAFGNYYTCGLVMQLAIDAEVKRTSQGTRDLFDVWAQFLARARAGAPANEDTFLSAASELGAAQAATFARGLATVPQDDPLQFLRTVPVSGQPRLSATPSSRAPRTSPVPARESPAASGSRPRAAAAP